MTTTKIKNNTRIDEELILKALLQILEKKPSNNKSKHAFKINTYLPTEFIVTRTKKVTKKPHGEETDYKYEIDFGTDISATRNVLKK